MKDELAARRAAKGIATIKIGADDLSIVRQVPTRAPAPARDSVARLRRIAAGPRQRV